MVVTAVVPSETRIHSSATFQSLAAHALHLSKYSSKERRAAFETSRLHLKSSAICPMLNFPYWQLSSANASSVTREMFWLCGKSPRNLSVIETTISIMKRFYHFGDI